jgi:hypothetical protein
MRSMRFMRSMRSGFRYAFYEPIKGISMRSLRSHGHGHGHGVFISMRGGLFSVPVYNLIQYLETQRH